MTIDFSVHNRQTAPAAAESTLAGAESAFGFLPNLLGVFAESPAVLKAYLTLGELFGSTSFSDTERQTVLLTISRYNDCRYCVAAHSTIADMQKVPAEIADAVRTDTPITDPRLEALRAFTIAMIDKRGWVSDADTAEFLAAGFSKANVLDVVLAVSFKTLSNYTNHIADTPLDAAFAAKQWTPPLQNAVPNSTE
ncbi:MAG: carboxymuconolactone decarboxylase family protein [Pseudomonadota bacterium]